MRFHWGLAPGHVYTHKTKCSNGSVSWQRAGEGKGKGKGNRTASGPSEAEREPEHSVDETPITRRGDTNTDVGGPQAQEQVDEGSASEGDDVEAEQFDIDLVDSSSEGTVERVEGDPNSGDEEEVAFEDIYGYVDSEGDDDF